MNILKDFSWHSAIGIDEKILSKKRIAKIPVSNEALITNKFIKAGNSDFLIHKSTKALWRFSDNGEFIEPVFEEDILTEDDLK